jgi:hypothetical protein
MKKLIIGLSLMVVLTFFTGISATAQTVNAGNDYWSTDSSDTYDDVNFPANTVYPGAPAWSGRIYFKGNPTSGAQYDTNIRRNNNVTLPSGTTSLTVQELHLKSTAPISVGGKSCDVFVETSSTSPSTGSMTISGDASGGTFSSTLTIVPVFTFACSGGFAESKTVFDMGSPFVQAVLKQQAQQAEIRMRKGIATPTDEAVVALCQAEPVPTEIEKDQAEVEHQATSTSSKCGVKLKASGPWSWCGGFCIPQPITVQDLLARHRVKPVRVIAVPQQ